MGKDGSFILNDGRFLRSNIIFVLGYFSLIYFCFARKVLILNPFA